MYFSPSRFSASPIQNIGIIGAKKYFIDHRTANAIQLFVPVKWKIFRSLPFQNKLQQRRMLQGLLDKYRHLTSLKWTLSSGRETCVHCQQIDFAVVLYFGQDFISYRLVNESKLQWFLLVINLFSRNHPTYFVFD